MALAQSRPDAPRRPPTSWWRAGRTLVPGAAVAAGVAIVATAMSRIAPLVGAPVIAIVGGMVVAATCRPSERLRPGLTFASRRVLQAAIVVLGLGLSFRDVVVTNERALPVLVGTLLAALVAARFVGRRLRLPGDVTTLIGVGTAICGASAIAAADAVIEADQADVGYAVTTIFAFNVAAVLAFPSIGHALGLSPHAFGLWAGTAVNDVSSVVAAASVYGHGAASYAVVVKLTRTLAIVPITLALAVQRRRRPGEGNARRLPPWRVLPLFLVAFAGAVGINSMGLVPSGWHVDLATTASWLITAALAAIGLSIDFGRLRRVGLRPIALGAVLWAVVSLASLGLQAATGTLS